MGQDRQCAEFDIQPLKSFRKRLTLLLAREPIADVLRQLRILRAEVAGHLLDEIDDVNRLVMRGLGVEVFQAHRLRRHHDEKVRKSFMPEYNQNQMSLLR